LKEGKYQMPTYSTKQFLKKVKISEATLRRWLSEKTRIPELNSAKKDWRGWRLWDESHINAVLSYKDKKKLNS
jgi:hypothetical protein